MFVNLNKKNFISTTPLKEVQYFIVMFIYV